MVRSPSPSPCRYRRGRPLAATNKLLIPSVLEGRYFPVLIICPSSQEGAPARVQGGAEDLPVGGQRGGGELPAGVALRSLQAGQLCR